MAPDTTALDCPEFVGSVDTTGFAYEMAVSGDFAYVTTDIC
jgi:hypothetical protein